VLQFSAFAAWAAAVATINKRYLAPAERECDKNPEASTEEGAMRQQMYVLRDELTAAQERVKVLESERDWYHAEKARAADMSKSSGFLYMSLRT